MRLLLDTNVFLDLPERRPGFQNSQKIILLLGRAHEGWVAWHTLSNVFYIADRLTRSRIIARELIHDILVWCTVVPVDHSDALRAENLLIDDFEDALQMAAALSVDVDVIITRDLKDYQNSPIPQLTPEQFLQLHHPELLG